MRPGPDYIYQCPECSNLLRKGSLWSGNTFGGKLYSDGKMVASMLPAFPNLTKCKKCGSLLWLSDMEEIGTDEWEHRNREYKTADRVEFLDIPDLFRFLELDIVKCSIEKEKIVRRKIWLAFNDRIRTQSFFKRKQIFTRESDEALWKQNCLRLLELYDPANISDKLMAAELYRNLGEFNVCVKILDSVDDEDCDWFVEKLKGECEKKNKLLVRLR